MSQQLNAAAPMPDVPIRVGISACLLGAEVRFDGGHKRDSFLVNTFGRFVEWVPVCPEVECGFGTPREAMRLISSPRRLRLITVKSAADVTARMEDYIAGRLDDLATANLSGYVFKKDSPSCGVSRVKVYDTHGIATRSGRGLFASAFLDRFPNVPVEEEGRLSDPRLRENFIERVFAYSRLQRLFDRAWTVGSLVRFHTAHKLMLMAHSPSAYRELGRLTAAASKLNRSELPQRYSDAFMRALTIVATPGRHTNVLKHMAGYLKKRLDSASKGELLAAIEDYRRELVPLIVPITLLRHHVRVHGIEYLAGQYYLEPHPKELMLRNHV
jgi:uncharacterized protein YbgA (DUF1722 family)/uncharacterized protein YbbK (DUF523 family)